MLTGSTNPIDDIIAMVATANGKPELKPGMLIPYKLAIASDPTDGNTVISVYGNPDAGIQGAMQLKYDRQELTRIYNEYGDVTRKPAISLSGQPGGKVKFFSLLPQIKAALGVEIITDGSWADAGDFDITIPNKDQYQEFAIVIAANSLQYVPGKNPVLRLLNTGITIGTVAIDRVLEPYLRANRTLVLNGPAYNVDTEQRLIPAIVLRSHDFTNVCLRPLGEILRRHDFYVANRNWTNWYFQDAFVDKVNAALAEITGVPGNMPKGQVLRSWGPDLYYDNFTHEKVWATVAKVATAYSIENVNRNMFTHALTVNIPNAAGFLGTQLYLPYNQFS